MPRGHFPLNCRDFTPNPTPRKAFGSGIRSSLCPGQHCCAGDPNPPAGLGGDEMWGGSVAGASHPLYSLADPFVSSSQPVSLFAASPGKSLLFRFLCRRKNVGLVLVFVLGGGGKAGGRGWKSGIPSGGDAQRWQLRENESNPSNPPPFQPPIRCFQKPHIFFSIYSDFLFLFPALCLLFIPIRPFLSRCCALLLPCFARSSLLRTPGRQDPQCATNTPRPPPQNPTPAPQIPTFGDAGPQIPALGRQIWVRIIRNHLQVTSYL